MKQRTVWLTAAWLVSAVACSPGSDEVWRGDLQAVDTTVSDVAVNDVKQGDSKQVDAPCLKVVVGGWEDDGYWQMRSTVTVISCESQPVTIAGIDAVDQYDQWYFHLQPGPLPRTLEPGGATTFEVSTWKPDIELGECGATFDTDLRVATQEHAEPVLAPISFAFFIDQVCCITPAEYPPDRNAVPVGQPTCVWSYLSPPVGFWGTYDEELELTKPANSAVELEPQSFFNEEHGCFTPDVPGTYRLRFRFKADFYCNIQPQCEWATWVITAAPEDGFYVELSWEGSETADLDLHLLHPDAVGEDLDGDGTPDGWLDPLWDAHAGNPTPDWSADGAEPSGPEVVAVASGVEGVVYQLPETYLSYRVGVSRSDTSSEPAIAQVRLFDTGYIGMGEDVAPFEIRGCELWEVATAEWHSSFMYVNATEIGPDTVPLFVCDPAGGP